MVPASRGRKPVDRKKGLEHSEDETSFVHRCLQVCVKGTRVDRDGIPAVSVRNDLLEASRQARRIKGAYAATRAPFPIADLDDFSPDSGMINCSFNEKTHGLAEADRSANRDWHFSGLGPRLEPYRI